MTDGPRWGEGPDEPAYPTGDLRYAPREAAGRKRPLLILALVLVPLVVIAATLIVLVYHGGSAQANGPLDGQLRGTYPTKPSPGWSLRAADVVPNAADPGFDSAGFNNSGQGPQISTQVIDLGHLLVAKVRIHLDRLPFHSEALAGLDAETGSVKWTLRDDDLGHCASSAIGRLLACFRSFYANSVQTDEVYFVNIDSGAVDHRIPAPEGTQMVFADGDDLITAGWKTISKGTPANLSEEFTTQMPADLESRIDHSSSGMCAGECTEYGSADNLFYFGSTFGVVLIDTRDGRILMDARWPTTFGAAGFVGRQCADAAREQCSWQIADPAGNLRFAVTDEDLVARPWLVPDPARMPVIIGDTAYDLKSSDKLWTAQGGPWNLKFIIGDRAIGSKGDSFHQEPPLVAFDIVDGKQLWSIDRAPYEVGYSISDGERIVFPDSRADSLSAINLASGREDWQLPIDGTVQPAADGFVAVGSDTMTYYPPTGGPSRAPD